MEVCNFRSTLMFVFFFQGIFLYLFYQLCWWSVCAAYLAAGSSWMALFFCPCRPKVTHYMYTICLNSLFYTFAARSCSSHYTLTALHPSEIPAASFSSASIRGSSFKNKWLCCFLFQHVQMQTCCFTSVCLLSVVISNRERRWGKYV